MAHLPFTPEEIQTLIRLWNGGYSITSIGRTLGRDPSNLCKKIRSMIANGTIQARGVANTYNSFKKGKVDWLAIRLAFRDDCRRIMAQKR